MDKNAKIICTIGPSCNNEEMLNKLLDAGMDIARLNFSHGSHEDHANVIKLIRELSKQRQKPIPILQDIQGPKLRVGNLPPEGVFLNVGQKIILTSQPSPINQSDTIKIPMDIPDLENCVHLGDRILMDDGNLEMIVTAVHEDGIEAQVILGGKLTSHKGVNLPGATLSIPILTEKDIKDLQFGLQQGVDAIAISFVSKSSDIETVRQTIEKIAPHQSTIPIIAKLERPEAVENLESIVAASEGVMVARGDLGVETSPEVVPIIQKRIIETANRHNKLVITATQMLDSMIHNPRPTRAEASDVANAILDGTDVVMLSGETAAGKYPQESVQIMKAIIETAENNFEKWGYHNKDTYPTQEDAISLTRAAYELAQDRNVAGIAVFTRSGRTALLMSKTRSKVPILAFTPDKHTYQRLGLYWGVTPYLVPQANTIESMLSFVETRIVTQKKLISGQQIIIISGYPVGAFMSARLLMLHTIGTSIQER